MLSHPDASEAAMGLVLLGKIPAASFLADNFTSPYDAVVHSLQTGGDITDVISKVGLTPIQIAKEAGTMVDPTLDWPGILRKCAQNERMKSTLAGAMRRIDREGEIDRAGLIAALNQEFEYGTRYVTLDQVQELDVVWKKSYYEPLDEHIGGIPDSGLTIIAAQPGSGKTSLMLEMAAGAAKQGKKVLLYSFEMTMRQILLRILQISDLTETERSRIMVTEEVLSMDEVAADVSQITSREDIYWVGLDFADLVIQGPEDEQKMAYIYLTAARLAKRTRVSFILVAQLNRNYISEVPKINHIRWSGMAEASAALIILPYNPNAVYSAMGKDDKLKPIPGRGYLIIGKSRFGFGDEETIGAIQVDWDGASAWGHESYNWISLA